MSDLAALVRALSARGVAVSDWTARTATTRTAWRALGADPAGGRVARVTLGALVHRDLAAGRGSAALEVGPGASLDGAVVDALRRAGAAVGPAWRSPSPAAPARVELADADIATDPGGPDRHADAVAGDLDVAVRAASAELVDASVTVERTVVDLETRRGLTASWLETRLEVTATVARAGLRTRLARTTRRRADLALGAAIADALTAAGRRAGAAAVAPGAYPVVVRAPALLHGGRGLLEALVGQADAALERQGLVRYHPGQPIARGATTVAAPLTVTSDGTLPFGLRSAPLTERGEAVRRFELVDRGVARDLAVDGREAFVRGTQPNGGVRGLVVTAGDAGSDELWAGPGPVLVIDRLDWLDVVPFTGHFRAGIGLAQIVDGERRRDVRGGVMRGDAVAALAVGRRSNDLATTGEYRGPAAWHLGTLAVD